jgi:hypothetical protein
MRQDDYEFKLVADEMSFSEQLQHMAGNITWPASTHLTEKPTSFPKDTFEAGGKPGRKWCRSWSRLLSMPLAQSPDLSLLS